MVGTSSTGMRIKPQREIRIVGRRPELVAGHEEEDEGAGLFEDVVQPLVLVRSCYLQQVDDDSATEKRKGLKDEVSEEGVKTFYERYSHKDPY